MSTNGDTMTTAEAGEQLLATVRAHHTGDEVDVDQALDDFAGTLPDGASADDVRDTVRTVVTYGQNWANRGDPAMGRLLALGRCYLIAAAIDRAAAPFPKLAELHAAELAVAQAEKAAAQALTDLEQAVTDHDVDRVMKLRGEVEVGHPGRIAEARKAMLQLQIEQARAHTMPGLARAAAADDAVASAQATLAAAIAAVKAAEIEVRGRLADREGARAAVREVETGVIHLTAQLDELTTNHAIDTEARLRRIAGLPEKVAPQAEEDGPRPTSLVGLSVQPYAPENRPDGFVSVGMARHIAAPPTDLNRG